VCRGERGRVGGREGVRQCAGERVHGGRTVWEGDTVCTIEGHMIEHTGVKGCEVREG
jgi:hypothetical protein